eukprot:scaffold1811_cov411-Prasinococcus_capsulatus_cf.AAC.18
MVFAHLCVASVFGTYCKSGTAITRASDSPVAQTLMPLRILLLNLPVLPACRCMGLCTGRGPHSTV